MILWLAVLLATPAWTPPATHTTPSGKIVDCAALRALPPGEVLGAVSAAGVPPAHGFGTLEACFARGPHVCDRAAVGHEIFGGLSMAVVEGVAPPIEARRAWFQQVCRGFTAAEQACLLMSAVDVEALAKGAPDACEPVRATLRARLAARQVKAPAPK